MSDKPENSANADSEAVKCSDLLSAEGIVKALADWSKKYPRERIYASHTRQKMDGELIELEEAAKLLVYRGR